MTWLKRIAIAFGALLIVVLAFAAWVLNAESGARWAAARAVGALGEQLAIGVVEGSLAGPLIINELRYSDPVAGLEFSAKRIAIDLALIDLLRRVVHVEMLDVSGVETTLLTPTAATPPPEESPPFTLDPPIDLAIDALALGNVVVRRDAEILLAIETAKFAGRWTSSELVVDHLDLRSPQGVVQFAGRASQTQIYSGRGKGGFNWRVGDKTYVGALTTNAQNGDVSLAVKLRRPLVATLNVFLEQTATTPWRFTLAAPSFDPRKELLPQSSAQSLAASLQGEGTLNTGTISGDIVVNGETLHLDPLRFTRDEKAASIAAVLRIGEAGGELHIDGDIGLAPEPLHADLKARWSELIIPALWAGQTLHTRGDLAILGNPQTFSVKGALALGPPARLADIAIISVDLTLPSLVDDLAKDVWPVDNLEAVRTALDGKDKAALTAAGGEAYAPLIDAAGPATRAITAMRAANLGPAYAARIDAVESLAKLAGKSARVTLDPTERQGFEYQTWAGFSLFADDIPAEIGRGGTYVIRHPDGPAESAVGFSLYLDALVDAGHGHLDTPRIFLPLNSDAGVGERLRAKGWVTVAALSDSDNAKANACTHIWNGEPKPL